MTPEENAYFLGMRQGLYTGMTCRHSTLDDTKLHQHLWEFIDAGSNGFSHAKTIRKLWEDTRDYRRHMRNRAIGSYGHACDPLSRKNVRAVALPKTIRSINKFYPSKRGAELINPIYYIGHDERHGDAEFSDPLKQILALGVMLAGDTNYNTHTPHRRMIHAIRVKKGYYEIKYDAVYVPWKGDEKTVDSVTYNRLKSAVSDWIQDKSFLKSSSRNFTGRLRSAILERDKYRCVLCKSQNSLEVDHIVPVSRGGQTRYSNGRTLCKKCNTGIYHHKQKTRRSS